MSERNTKPAAGQPALWTRRETIMKVSAMLGGTALVGQTAMLAGCGQRDADSQAKVSGAARDGLFSHADVELLDEIAETILPETSTPGAKAAGVGAFVALMVEDCYSPEEQDVFRSGLATLDDRCRDEFGSGFMDASPEQRLALLTSIDREQYEDMQIRAGDEPAHYFRMLKEQTVLGFFSSEVAYTEVLEYEEAPGRYEPCRDFGPDVRMMAGHAASLGST